MSRSDSPHGGADIPDAAVACSLGLCSAETARAALITRDEQRNFISEQLGRVMAEQIEAGIADWMRLVATYGVYEIRDTRGYSLQGAPMAYEWSKEEYARLHPAVQAARTLLEDWFRAIENGTAKFRMPDPRYPTAIDTATCDKVIAHLGLEFAREIRAWAGLETAGGYDVGPGFDRLLGPQRLALCQALHRIKREHFPQETQD